MKPRFYFMKHLPVITDENSKRAFGKQTLYSYPLSLLLIVSKADTLTRNSVLVCFRLLALDYSSDCLTGIKRSRGGNCNSNEIITVVPPN